MPMNSGYLYESQYLLVHKVVVLRCETDNGKDSTGMMFLQNAFRWMAT